jgi:hypothetical protein
MVTIFAYVRPMALQVRPDFNASGTSSGRKYELGEVEEVGIALVAVAG